MAAVRVVIVDDMLLLRDGLARILRDRGVEVVAEASSGDGLVDLVRRTQPDVVILDIRMPPTFTDEGLVAAAAVREAHPNVAILVLSQFLDAAHAVRLLQETPERSGYLLKDRVMDMATLVDALRRLTEGETVIDPTIVSQVMRRRRSSPAVELTDREQEVLSLVAEGLSNRAIADRLVINERTVETHTARIFTKLGLAQSPELHRRVSAVLTYLRS
jgi:DNA-binding NarL/FixJ family response regulator